MFLGIVIALARCTDVGHNVVGIGGGCGEGLVFGLVVQGACVGGRVLLLLAVASRYANVGYVLVLLVRSAKRIGLDVGEGGNGAEAGVAGTGHTRTEGQESFGGFVDASGFVR